MIDISFKDYRKNDIHGVSLYPATMIAPVQQLILEDIFENNEIKSVFDPYHGSGTALYEAAILNPKCEIIGCDINPLANLITYIKLKGVTGTIQTDIQDLFLKINNAPAYVFEFNNIHKWFRADIQESLKKIRWAITQIKSKRNRAFFWIVFSNVIRKYSNSRSSTYKLHIKKPLDIENLRNNVIEDFKNQVEKNYSKFYLKSKNVTLYKQDILKACTQLQDKSIDLTITSPPYGDNATTVTYGQFSSLALYWIDNRDLNLEGWELDNYSIIDNKSLGSNKSLELCEIGADLLNPYLSQITMSKHKKVITFFSDYFKSIDEFTRITNKYIVMTLGNRTVDGVNINLTEITKNYLQNMGFINLKTLQRDIPNKRIPRITSSVRDRSVSSMNEEFVIIHQRA